VTFAATGTSASAFSAVTSGSCTTTSTGASFATTVTFTPTSVGLNSATLTATDSLTHTGTATLSGTGTPAPFAATPTFSVPAGTYTTVQSVTISDTVTTAAIHYTTDGSTPTSSSTLASGPITVSASETINAIAVAPGYQNSAVGTAAYVINLPAAATPTFSVAAGTYTTPQTVAISDSNAGVAIFYTTDGTTPTTHSTPYTAPISLVQTTTITAIAFPSATAPNFVPSAAASAVYTINLPVVATPTFSVAGGTYATVQSVTISDTTAGAKIYYTTNGATPTSSSTPYTAAIHVPASITIKAIAINSPNYNNSAVATAAYIISLPTPGITITASNSTINTVNGTGSTTLTIAANAAMNGTVAFTCSGFFPVGATCSFSPATVPLLAGATGTTAVTITLPKTTAGLRHDSGPMLPGTVLAALLGFFGLRKRRRLQVLLLLLVSVIGLNVFTGCATTSANTASASQFVVTGTAASCPDPYFACAQPNQPPGTPSPTPVSQNIQLILTTP
jgi:Chitobiase/beta-hexosaminidase C-terminal domain